MATAQAVHMSHRLTNRLFHYLDVGTSIVKSVSLVVRIRVRSGLELRNCFSLCPQFIQITTIVRPRHYFHLTSRLLLIRLKILLPVPSLQVKPGSHEITCNNNIRTWPGEGETVYVDISIVGTKQSAA